MILVAGLSLGLWLVLPDVQKNEVPRMGSLQDFILIHAFWILGGLSVVGPLLLLLDRRRGPRRPWGAGRLLWFSTGTSAWLLWPPIVFKRTEGQSMNDAATAICFAYGTPLMAVYVVAALLAGGWLRKSRRRRMKRSWRETFGLCLGLAWACTGLYVLWILYRER